jgi:hypothetical protein
MRSSRRTRTTFSPGWSISLARTRSCSTPIPSVAWRRPTPSTGRSRSASAAFLELATIAASADGHAVETTLYPEGDGAGRPVALMRFAPGGIPDPLFAQVLGRRSCKEPFDMARPVPEAVLAALAAAAHPGAPVAGTLDPARVEGLRALIRQAWIVEAETPRTWAESVDLLRIGRREIEAQPDGIDLQGPVLDGLRRVGLVPRAALIDPEGQAFRTTQALYEAMFAATPAFVWVTSPGNERTDQIAAGRSWLRLNLAATAAGLALHPVSQALQEYPEMAEHYAEAHARLAAPGETVQMLGRLGYGPAVPETPRWPLEAKLMDG